MDPGEAPAALRHHMMNNAQRRNENNPEKPFPGCLGRMVNLFDLNAGIHHRKLLTDRPRYNDSLLPKIQSDHRHEMQDNLRALKIPVEEDMPMEPESKNSCPNVVAKLMGLETLPSAQPCSAPPKIEDLAMIRRTVNEQKLSLVRRKFTEAKRLATDEKLRQSKEFEDALEVLISNQDIFEKFLQEPNSVFSKNLYEFHSLPSSPGTKRITILRPWNAENFKVSSRTSDKTWKNPAQVDQNSSTTMRNQRDDEFKVETTRIVVLKPSRPKIDDPKNVVSLPSLSPGIVHGESLTKEPDNHKAEPSRRLAREITQKLRANLMGNQMNNNLFVSAVFSNACSGNDSSFNNSESVQAFENSSDSEFMSPSSRHSWDYVKRSPECSISKQAKKRLSERWAVMASHGNSQEQRGLRRNSHTLRDMLALSETAEDEDKNLAQMENLLGKQEDSSMNLMRSKSVRMSKTEEKETDSKSSFKGKVSRLFFPRNNDDGLEGCSLVSLSSNIPSASTNTRHQRDIACHEKGSAFFSMSQEQPRRNLVLESHFDKNDSGIAQESYGYVRQGYQQQLKSIIEKSPLIESIARTLQRDDSCSCALEKSPLQTWSVPSRAEEERSFLLYTRTLLTMAGLESGSPPLRWHSLENPLDPSLRDKYANLDSKEPLLKAKRKELKSYRTLVYDCVAAALVDFMDDTPYWNRKSTSNYGSHDMTVESASPISMDGVLAKMKGWFDNEARSFEDDEEQDSSGRVLERVVREKVVGKEWVESLKNEGENIGREIEVNLLQELVEEAANDFAYKS